MSRGHTYIPIEEGLGWIFDLSNFVVTPLNSQITVIRFLKRTSQTSRHGGNDGSIDLVSVDIWSELSVTGGPNKANAFSWSLIPHICLPLINGELHDLRWQSCTLQSFDGRHQWLFINWDSMTIMYFAVIWWPTPVVAYKLGFFQGLKLAGRDNFVRLLGNLESCSISLTGVKVDSTYPGGKTWVFLWMVALPGGGTSGSSIAHQGRSVSLAPTNRVLLVVPTRGKHSGAVVTPVASSRRSTYTRVQCKNCSLCETLGAGNKHSEIADIKTTLQTNQHEWQKRSGFKKQGTSDTSELISHLNQVE